MPAVTSTDEHHTLETNAYAVAYRLIGDRPAARAVAGIAAVRVAQAGGLQRDDWLYWLVEYTVEQTVGPGAPPAQGEAAEDPHAGLREALRRRLERAGHQERVAAALVHLSGYPPDFVAAVVNCSPEDVPQLARLLAPPPGIDYRDLGDPALTKRVTKSDRSTRHGPHWTTIAAVVLIVALIIAATQITGPRPSFGPPLDDDRSTEGRPSDPDDE